MDNMSFLSVMGGIALIIVVLTFSFYLIYPLITSSRVQKHSGEIPPSEKDLEKEEKEKVQTEALEVLDTIVEENMSNTQKEDTSKKSPIVSYRRQANAIRDESNRIEYIVENENQALSSGALMPDYHDDPSSIDLGELRDLRLAIKRMTKELSTVRRSNISLQRKIEELTREHKDAIGRVNSTDLWEAEKRRWSREFEEAYRSYELAKTSVPPKDKTSTTNNKK